MGPVSRAKRWSARRSVGRKVRRSILACGATLGLSRWLDGTVFAHCGPAFLWVHEVYAHNEIFIHITEQEEAEMGAEEGRSSDCFDDSILRRFPPV